MITIDPRFTDQFKACIQVGLGLVNKHFPITQNLYFEPYAKQSPYGWCEHPSPKKTILRIGINTRMIHDEDIITTVVHEILHSFLDSLYMEHTGIWKERAEFLNKTYPKLGALQRSAHYEMDTSDCPYVVTCTNCKQTWHYKTKPKWFNSIKTDCACPYCKTHTLEARFYKRKPKRLCTEL